MASAAEQLAANLSLGTFSKATELKQRIWFTLTALIVYRLGTYIPIPGVDASVMAEMMQRPGGGIFGMLDMFSGGAVRRVTVFALGIMPYISASIIIQLMTAAVPSLEALKKEGEMGRKKLNQYTRYLTAFIAMFQSYGIAVGLESMHGSFGPAVLDRGVVLPLLLHHHPGRRHDVPDVAGRADHRPRHRQRPEPDHHVRYRRRPAGRARLTARSGPHRRAVAGLRPGVPGHRRRHDRRHRVRGTRATAHPRAISEAADGQPHVRRRHHAHAAEDQHLGRDPADLRQFAAADPRHAGRLHDQRAGLGAGHHGPVRAWPAGLHDHSTRR